MRHPHPRLLKYRTPSVFNNPHYLPTVCHERTKGFYTPKCAAVQEMRVGPSESTFRSRFQTTLSCAGKEPGW